MRGVRVGTRPARRHAARLVRPRDDRAGRGDAGIEVWRSRHVALHDLVVTARRTAHSASILVPDSRDVTIRRSTFTHCGDHDPEFVNCITLYRWSHDVVIEDNHFHDCFGCDFVNGRFGSDLVIRDNRFERALPCRMAPTGAGTTTSSSSSPAGGCRRAEPLRRLPGRRRPALPDERRRLRHDRQQRLRRLGSARARLPRAHGDRHREPTLEAHAAVREGRRTTRSSRATAAATGTPARSG